MQRGILFWAMVLLMTAALVALVKAFIKAGSYKDVWTYVCAGAAILLLPVCFNVLLLISPNVVYHSLMRYQWVLLPIAALAILDRHTESGAKRKISVLMSWTGLVTAAVITFQYAVICNIGYFNLEKKYEKTYAYCLRLLEQMEETEGYYHGMPVAMTGVIGEQYLPGTDLTQGITDSLVGVNGDYLFYTAENYKEFMKYYFGVSIVTIPIEDMPAIYYSQEYKELSTFPKENSMKVINGILYIKTENEGD